MIGIFLGEQNNGKTLSMVYYALRYYINGYTIYSNFNLSIPHKKLNKNILEEYTKGLKQFNKAVFLIDELYLFIDSRSSSASKNKIFSYFILQTSKRDVHLFGTAQFFKTLDVRFRDHVFFQCHCVRTIFKNENFEEIKTSVRLLTEELNKLLYIKCVFFTNGKDGFNFNSSAKTHYIKAKEIFKYYDTKELMAID